jgi:competence protein ComEA
MRRAVSIGCREITSNKEVSMMTKSRFIAVASAFLICLLIAGHGLTASADSARPVNINTASASELAAINGLGEVKAKAIVAYREQKGPFKSVDELKDVKGIGEHMLAKLRPQVTLGAAAEAPSGAVAPQAKH